MPARLRGPALPGGGENPGAPGPLPAELQDPNLVWVAGSPFFSEQPVAAKALIDFLADPKAAAVYKAKGFQPG